MKGVLDAFSRVAVGSVSACSLDQLWQRQQVGFIYRLNVAAQQGNRQDDLGFNRIPDLLDDLCHQRHWCVTGDMRSVIRHLRFLLERA